MTQRSLHQLSVATSLALLLFFSGSLASGPEKNEPAKTSSVATNDFYAPFLINNVFTYYANNGWGSFNPTWSGGFEFYKGGNKHIIFLDGIVWGGFHKGFAAPKVGGSYYRTGLQAGPIVTYGTPTTNPVAADPANPAYRIYRVRPDITPHTLEGEAEAKLSTDEVPFTARYDSVSAKSLYDQYIKDWNEWPAALGAPYTDVDGNGIYDPAVDVPGVPGADQTLWYVANDMDAARVNGLAACPPIGLEMQRTIWGYRRADALRNTIFLSTLLINKSGAPVDSMFLEQFVDPDVGDGRDDLVGCDTLRDLGYAYNGRAVDSVYGASVPAPGYLLLQGPRVASPGDSALFRLGYRHGYRNIGMTAFLPLSGISATFSGPGEGYLANTKWYRLMNGVSAPTANPFIDPTTGKATKLCVSGDPVTGQGWIDGTGELQPYDRRFCFATGPFTFAAGDTQEVVIATTAGLGADHLSSITALRSTVGSLRGFFNTLLTSVPQTGVPTVFALHQNYPNPFNPSTTIRYQLPGVSHVALQIYDLLGREVALLINGTVGAGTHEVRWNPRTVATGVYFYRLEATPQDGRGGKMIQTKKMVYLQ